MLYQASNQTLKSYQWCYMWVSVLVAAGFGHCWDCQDAEDGSAVNRPQNSPAGPLPTPQLRGLHGLPSFAIFISVVQVVQRADHSH